MCRHGRRRREKSSRAPSGTSVNDREAFKWTRTCEKSLDEGNETFVSGVVHLDARFRYSSLAGIESFSFRKGKRSGGDFHYRLLAFFFVAEIAET